jgi:hypothetical protein
MTKTLPVLFTSTLILTSCGKTDLLAQKDTGSLSGKETLDKGGLNSKTAQPEFTVAFTDFPELSVKHVVDPKVSLFSKLSVKGLSQETFENARTLVSNLLVWEGVNGLKKDIKKLGVNLNWNFDLPEEGIYRVSLDATHKDSKTFRSVKSKSRTLIYDRTPPVVVVEGKTTTDVSSGLVRAEFKLKGSDLTQISCDKIELFEIGKEGSIWNLSQNVKLGDQNSQDFPKFEKGSDGGLLAVANRKRDFLSDLIVAENLPAVKTWSLGLRGDCRDETGNVAKVEYAFKRDDYGHFLSAEPVARKGSDPSNPSSSDLVYFSKTGTVKFNVNLLSTKDLKPMSAQLLERDRDLWKVVVSEVPYLSQPNHRNTITYALKDSIDYTVSVGLLGNKTLYVTLLRVGENSQTVFMNSQALSFYFDNTAPAVTLLTGDQFLQPSSAVAVNLQVQTSSTGAPVDINSTLVEESVDNVVWVVSPIGAINTLSNSTYELSLVANRATEVPFRYRLSFLDLAGNVTRLLSKNILGAVDLVRSTPAAERTACGAKSKLSVQYASKFYCESGADTSVYFWFSNKGSLPMTFGTGLSSTVNELGYRLFDLNGGTVTFYSFPRSEFAANAFVESQISKVVTIPKSEFDTAARGFSFDAIEVIESGDYKFATAANSTCYVSNIRPELVIRNVDNTLANGLSKSPFPCE